MLYQSVERNLREAMKFFSLANEEGEVREMPGTLIISSGINYGVFNSALLTAPVNDAEALKRCVTLANVHFRARGLRWSLWGCEDLLAPAARRRMKKICGESGLRLLTDPPGMHAERLNPPERALPPLDIRRVSDASTRLAFCHIASVVFELPFAIAKEVYEPECAWLGNFAGYIGFANGDPVAIAATVATPDAIGLYSVATLPAHQRRGYGEAMIRRALDAARREFGVEASVLQSSRSGYSLYQRLGYRVVTRFVVFLSL